MKVLGVFQAGILHVGRRRSSFHSYASDANERTVAFAGLIYLSLWLCAKLGISIPFLGPRNLPSALDYPTPVPVAKEQRDSESLRTRDAAPPTYLLIFPLIPVGAAIYISCTRYSDYWHHGFDVLVSGILGILTAWLGFRWYHMPIRKGGGWAWAPRSPKRAYWKSSGVLTYGDTSNQKVKDLETGGTVGGQFSPPPVPQSTRYNTSEGSSRSYEMNDLATAPQAPTDFLAHKRDEQSRRPIR